MPDNGPSVDVAKIAEAAREVAAQTVARVGVATPNPHAAALIAIASTWEAFAQRIEAMPDGSDAD